MCAGLECSKSQCGKLLKTTEWSCGITSEGCYGGCSARLRRLGAGLSRVCCCQMWVLSRTSCCVITMKHHNTFTTARVKPLTCTVCTQLEGSGPGFLVMYDGTMQELFFLFNQRTFVNKHAILSVFGAVFSQHSGISKTRIRKTAIIFLS